MDDREREQGLLAALTTEHFVLQTSPGSTITEAVGRATIYLSTVSAALIGLGFAAGNERRGRLACAAGVRMRGSLR